jgi:hypothetical protein
MLIKILGTTMLKSSKGAQSLGPVDVDKVDSLIPLSLKWMHSLASDKRESAAYDEALYIFYEIIRLLFEWYGKEKNIHVGAK